MNQRTDMQLDEAFRRRFTLERVLGRGGMGAVWLAEERGLGRKVAVKFLRRQLAESEADAVARFEVEARVTAALNHPNIVRIFDFGVSGPYNYLVVEFVDGPTLQRIIDEDLRPRTEAWVSAVGVAVANALDHAHGQGIIHRDVKPENVLIDGAAPEADLDGDELSSVKVTDFGIAKAPSEISDVRTKTGIVLGTPYTMSPEQCRGERLDPRSDVYALGAVLYHLLAGRPPFLGSPMDVIMGHLKGSIPDLAGIRPELSPALVDAIHRALARNAADRFPSAALFATALRGAARATGSPAPPVAATRARDLSGSTARPSAPTRAARSSRTALSPRPGEARSGEAPRPAAARTSLGGALGTSQERSGLRPPLSQPGDVPKAEAPRGRGRGRLAAAVVGVGLLVAALAGFLLRSSVAPELLSGDVLCALDDDGLALHLSWTSPHPYAGEAEFRGERVIENAPTTRHGLALPWPQGENWRSSTLRFGSVETKLEAPVLRFVRRSELRVNEDDGVRWLVGIGLPRGTRLLLDGTGGEKTRELEIVDAAGALPLSPSDLLAPPVPRRLLLPDRPIDGTGREAPPRLRFEVSLREDLEAKLLGWWRDLDEATGLSAFGRRLENFNGITIEVLPHRGKCPISWDAPGHEGAIAFLRRLVSVPEGDRTRPQILEGAWTWIDRLHRCRLALNCAAHHWKGNRDARGDVFRAAARWLAILPALNRDFDAWAELSSSRPPRVPTGGRSLFRTTFSVSNAYLAPDNSTWARNNFDASIFRSTDTILGATDFGGKRTPVNWYEAFVDSAYNRRILERLLEPMARSEGMLVGLDDRPRADLLGKVAARLVEDLARPKQADTEARHPLVELARRRFRDLRPDLALFLGDDPRDQVYRWSGDSPLSRDTRKLLVSLDVQGLGPPNMLVLTLGESRHVALYAAEEDDAAVRNDPELWLAELNKDASWRPALPSPERLRSYSVVVPRPHEDGPPHLELRMLRLAVASLFGGLEYCRILRLDVRELP